MATQGGEVLRLLLLVQFMQPQQQVLGRRLLILEWSSRTLCLSHQFRKVCMHKTLLLLNIVSLWYSLVEERTQHCLHSHFCCYPHMPVGRVWIYRLLFVCFFLFVWLWISPPRIKLTTSNFSRWFFGVLGKESHILGNFAPPEAQNRTNRIVCSLVTGTR